MIHYWIIIITFLFSTLFWESSFLYPLKMLAVLIHEFWHSLIALFFNVEWIQLHVFENEAGKTILKGEIPVFGFILIASAGYIGTVFTASLLLRSLLKKELCEIYYFLFCAILFIISFILTPSSSLAFYICFLWSIFLIFLYLFNKKISIYVFSFVQSFILFYSFYDLLDFSKNPNNSDIGILYKFLKYKQLYHGNLKEFSYIIATIWILIIITIFYKFIISLMFQEDTKAQDNKNVQTKDIPLVQNTKVPQQSLPPNYSINEPLEKSNESLPIKDQKSN